MAHDLHGKQARLQRIARIRSIKASDANAAEAVTEISSHPHFEARQARREVMLVAQYEKLLHPDWHDDAYL